VAFAAAASGAGRDLIRGPLTLILIVAGIIAPAIITIPLATLIAVALVALTLCRSLATLLRRPQGDIHATSTHGKLIDFRSAIN
jgi:hypothetical protein